VSFAHDDGRNVTVHLLQLSVRQLAEDDYRLYGYGREGGPVVDVRFSEGAGPGPEPVAVEIKNVDEASREGNVVVTVFGKYQAQFRAAYTGD
jgi:hypothetical protein